MFTMYSNEFLKELIVNSLAVLAQARDSAVLAIGTRALLGRLLAARVTLEAVAGLALVLARVGDLAGITIVGVDAAEDTAVDGDRVLDDDVAGTRVVLAVTAATHQLAVVLGVEVLDLDSALAVELEDFVVGVESTTTVDVRGARALLEGGSVLADISPPDVVQGAGRLSAECRGNWRHMPPVWMDTHQVPRQ